MCVLHPPTLLSLPRTQGIVAAGTLFVEQKFIHNAGLAGHIEDVVVTSRMRGECGGLVVFPTQHNERERERSGQSHNT